tara:strand:- start:72 stop:455 length:384 start_codon:yes stop_codon:yes gene_type:complete
MEIIIRAQEDEVSPPKLNFNKRFYKMKKYIILSLVSFSLITVSCSDEAKEVTACVEITADFTSSMEKFNNYMETGEGDGKSLCDNYASSLQEMVDEGCMSLSDLEMDQEEYEMVVNGTFCSLLTLMN